MMRKDRAGYAYTEPSGLQPLCARCVERARVSQVFADLIVRAIALGHTLPAMRDLFKRLGLALPITVAECRAADAALRPRWPDMPE